MHRLWMEPKVRMLNAGDFNRACYARTDLMNISNTPSTLPFKAWGLVPSLCAVSGLPILILRAFGESSFSNRKLMLGAFLLLFDAMWYYDKRMRMRREFFEAAKVVLFGVFAAIAGYRLVYGRLPFLFKNCACVKH